MKGDKHPLTESVTLFGKQNSGRIALRPPVELSLELSRKTFGTSCHPRLDNPFLHLMSLQALE